jgi:hypothetical protein
MPEARDTILVEVNELPFRVVDDYVARKPRSEFARVLRRSKQFITVCEDQVALDPWSSWPTLHRGVIDRQHGILHLGQSLCEANWTYPPLWELLAQRGVKVGVMGSLHTAAAPRDLSRYAFYVPDFFADTRMAHPNSLRPLQAFNLALTRAAGRNVAARIALREVMRFLVRYPLQGMTASTVARVVSVLLAERRRPHQRARRRSLQALITLDVFLDMMQRTLPGFATFHTNHVAAAMHRYGAAAYPDDAAGDGVPKSWRARYVHEIDFTLDVLDQMLSRLLRFVERHPNYRLLIASSLGQAPATVGFVPPGQTPHGMLVVYDPQHPSLERGRATISTLDIAPTLLQSFGIAPPAYMRKPDETLLDPTARSADVERSATAGAQARLALQLEAS